MAWRDLPPRLRGRTPKPPVFGSLVALVATPLFGLVWLFGPIALAVLFVAREQWILTALAIPFALWWTFLLLFREPVVIGLLASIPYGTWSLVQQWRDKVDTEDLEDGRYVGLAPWRGLTERERGALDLLAGAVPELAEARDRLGAAEVRAECVCGCPSILLYGTGPSVPRELGLDELTVTAEGDGAVVVMRLHLGHVRELEVTCRHGHDGTPSELPPAERLRLRDDDSRAGEAS